MSKARNQAQAKLIADVLNDAASKGFQTGVFDGRRIDADETAMLALALEDMRARVYAAEFPELTARAIIPVASDVDPGAETFSWEEEAYAGSVKQISDDGYADDPPSTEIMSRKQRAEIIDLGGVVHYTLADMRRAAFSGRPLESRKLEAFRRVYEANLDSVAWTGKTLDNSGLSTVDTSLSAGLANKVVGTSNGQIRGTAMTAASWDSTPDAAGMVTDLMKAVAEFVDTSKGTRTPKVLVLPALEYMRLYQTYTSDGNPETAAERFLRANGFVRQIVMSDRLDSVDAGGNGSRGLLLDNQADVLELVIPMEFTVLPPQQNNFAFKVLGMGRTAGTLVYRPLGARYLTGLPNT